MFPGNSALPPGLHRSRLFWLGILSVAFLTFARIDSGSVESGVAAGPFIAFSGRGRVVIFADFRHSRTFHTWREPNFPSSYPPEVFERTGYSQTRIQEFLHAHTYQTLSLPYSLLIGIATLISAILVYLRQRRHERHRGTLRDITIQPRTPAS